MRPIPIVFVMALAVRLAGQIVLGAYVHPETWEYEAIADNILAGHGYSYLSGGVTYLASVSSPAYVLLTALVYALTAHSQAAMLVLQALLGAATASLAAWLVERAFAGRGALEAGTLVALDPGLVVYASKLHSLTLDALAFTAVVCAAVLLRASPTWPRAALTGALVGLGALTRTTALAFVPLVLFWARRRIGLASALVFVVAAAAAYAPWPTRNSIVLGQFVPGSSESTEWLWRGTNPAATGSSWTIDGRTMLEVAPADFRARVAAASEAERIAIYRDAALQFVREQPVQTAVLYARKLKAFWWGSESTGILYPPAWVLVYQAWYLGALTLAIVGAWSARRDPTVVLIVLSALVISAAQAVFYVEGRHRLAIEPLLLVLSGGGLVALSGLLRLPLVQSDAHGQPARR